MADLPQLRQRIAEVTAAAAKAPGVAADTMEGLVAEGGRRGVSPGGDPLAPRKDGQPYDQAGHVAGSYKPVVRGDQAMIASGHRAAGFLRRGTRKMVARPLTPGQDEDLGWWLPAILRKIRGLFGG